MSDATRTITLLREAMSTATHGHHLSPDSAERALDEAGRHRPVGTYLAVAACLVGVVVLALVLAVQGNDDKAAPPADAPCAPSPGLLPTWARSGFSRDAYDMPHVLGARGRIVAIPFADPLRARPAEGSSNKILWVARDGSAGSLRIEARLGDRRVARTVDLGPSSLDLPLAGCWQLRVSWAGHSDDLALRYAP